MRIRSWLDRYRRSDRSDLATAFPPPLSDDTRAVLDCLPSAALGPLGSFTVSVDGAQLEIPSRIYNDEPTPSALAKLSPSQLRILHCLYTRHHDGHVRQRHLEEIIAVPAPWVAPYVVQLIGEYVIEILASILERLDLTEGSPTRLLYGRFVADNPRYLEITAARVVSYWNCYYRFDFPVARPLPPSGTYPGFLLIDALRSAALDADTSYSTKTPGRLR